MCGIAGVVRRTGPPPKAEVEGLLACLVHRGPDAQGVYGRAQAAIGQTRLAVIDLIAGDPPITNEDGTVGAALNGEIYNYRALRAELRHDGHRLATEGDTEVIAHLAEDCAPIDLARKLDGMFAFSAWDDRRNRLILGRDRLGKKPLYYWAGPGCFVFGSELKAVLAHPAVPRRLAPDVIPGYLALGYVPTPRTFYQGICSLPPGCVLSVSPGEDPVVEQYWSPPVAGCDGVVALDVSPDEAAAEVRRLLTIAIERRLVADVPVGAFLSGGVDSSAIVAILSTLRDGSIPTFTIGFEDDDGLDERPFARQVAERFGTEHLEFVVRPDAAELVERLLWHHDQPFGDSSALPTLLLSELTRQHVTVALSGDGGDELFAGYERFSAALARRYVDRAPAPLRRAVSGAVHRLPAGALRGRAPSVQRMLARPDVDTLGAYVDWVGFVPAEWRQRLVADPAGPSDGWWWDDYQAIWRSSAGAAPLDRLLDLNLRTYLVDDLLPKVDRMSMAHALEVRSPFLDVDLLEFAARLPPSMKLRGLSRKRVLKAAVADLLPPEILNRRKRGFGLPIGRWFNAELAGWVDSLLCSSRSRVRSHLDGAAVDDYIADHRRTQAHGHGIWTLVTLELFLRREGW